MAASLLCRFTGQYPHFGLARHHFANLRSTYETIVVKHAEYRSRLLRRTGDQQPAAGLRVAKHALAPGRNIRRQAHFMAEALPVALCRSSACAVPGQAVYLVAPAGTELAAQSSDPPPAV